MIIMEINKISKKRPKKLREIALHYMKTLTDVAREPFLILESNLRVISANPNFYQDFGVIPKKTEGKFLYELGDGQWNIPELKKMLENILPNKKVVKDYEVTHNFEIIGEKTMLLNARQVDQVQLIILAIEDITARKELDNKLTNYSKDLEEKVAAQTKELSNKIEELESINEDMVGRELNMVALKKEIKELKKKIKNGNGKNGNHKNIK